MNWGMIGHEWAVQLLRQYIIQGDQRHAYLFTGPAGIGRRTLALRFAQALNCHQPLEPGEPCLTCRTCQLIGQMNFPDLSVISAEQPGSQLRVEQIRDLQRVLALTPYEASYRVALLLRFEEANQSAANALLKTLEEPAPKVVLILTAESSERLLPTIVSRCEVLRLRPIQLQEISQGLNARSNISQQEVDLIAHLSNGRPGYAIKLIDNPEALELRHTFLEEHLELMNQGIVERFTWVQQASKDRESLRDLLLIWLSFWRDVLLLSNKVDASLTNIDFINEIKAFSSRTTKEIPLQMVRALENTLGLIEKNVNVRLALEVLMLDLPPYPK
jgi:DNA polymerase-3 subunit delta'